MKTSLAPGSKVVTEYLERADLMEPLSKLGFDLVGYGCTTCIGNSGPLPRRSRRRSRSATSSGERAVRQPQLRGPHPPRGEDELPRLAAAGGAYALAGRMDLDLVNEPLQGGRLPARHLADAAGGREAIESAIESDMFRKSYGEVFEGDENWNALDMPEGDRYAWDADSTYVKRPPYFDGMPAEAPEGFEPIGRARDRRARRQRHHRPHLARRRDQEGLAGRGST